MSQNALISYLGENKPNLISEVTSRLTELDGEFSGVTFATLGRVCELTMVYHTSEKISLEELSDLKQLSSLKTEISKLNQYPSKMILVLPVKLLTELFYQVMIKKVY